MINQLPIEADNFNDIYCKSLKLLLTSGVWTKPRGQECLEVIAPQIVLTNPLNCLITLRERKLNYAYAIIEKLMYVSMKCDVETICWYNPGMKKYVNQETGKFDGAYGERIAKNDQLFWCYKKLKEDPDTRQAVITIHDYTDCHETLDPACTLSLQFLIRDNKLHLICNMRSNDLLWGTCLDVQAFCFIQEIMAHWLGLELGNYYHQPASLHYYKEQETNVKNAASSISLVNEELPRWDVSVDDHKRLMDTFWEEEYKIRNNKEMDLMRLKESTALTNYLLRLKKFTDKRHATI